MWKSACHSQVYPNPVTSALICFSCPLFFSDCALSSVRTLSGCDVYVPTDGQSVPSVSDSSIHPSPSATKVTAESREMSGGQMMSFIDKLTAYPPTEGPRHRFASTYPPIYRHCSRPYQTNGDVKRNEQTESRSDFLRLETERFRCSESSRGPLPFDVRRRNDTNCILPQ